MSPLVLLRAQVKACLDRESKLSADERKNHQWMFSTSVGDVNYVVGKGGANTMFYSVNGGERKVCYPIDMIEKMDKWIKSKFIAFAVADKSGKVLSKCVPLEKTVLQKACPSKYANKYVVGIDAQGHTHKLYQSIVGLSGTDWVPVKKKK